MINWGGKWGQEETEFGGGVGVKWLLNKNYKNR